MNLVLQPNVPDVPNYAHIARNAENNSELSCTWVDWYKYLLQ